MNNGNSVLKKVFETVCEHNMINRGERILAAVSGGADSVCMLHVLNALKTSLGFSIYCAHLNHGLRGEAADRDERFVVELCGKLDIPVFTKTVDVRAFAEKEKLTLEEAGRVLRYEFFDELSKRHRIEKIATAHNKNDNAETVLMRVFRGTGIDGLCGISYRREDGVIRPLLDTRRYEIEEYCRENNLSFCTDETNNENEYTRNKIRNELLPYLAENFNSDIVDSLFRLSENAKEDGEFLSGYARRLYERLRGPISSKKPVMLHIESLSMVSRSIASRVVRIAADEAVKGAKLEKKHIDDIFILMTKETGARLSLPKGLVAEVQYGWLTFSDSEQKIKALADDKFFFTEVSPGDTVFVQNLEKNIYLKTEDARTYKCKINEQALDYDKLGGRVLFLRSRRDGDRMVCFSDGRTKKIKNILIDGKVPRSDRDKILLLCTGDEVLAIVGSRVSEKYKTTKETERALVIRYGDIDE
ncbi:MAG: tRNA lysidine(34) synthetase TilS [Clostridia bacterium]|nr:tRNA lysidine(34) synthetase TilS [Clostridia bacterium]